jgi:uncharacterized membrane protein HdeD (DUF308 family)
MFEYVKEFRRWYIAMGLFFLLLGILAVIFPFVSSLAAEIMFGAMLSLAGVFYLIVSFRARRWKGFLVNIAFGALYLSAGLLLVFFPLRGLFVLTYLLAALFLLAGIGRLILAGILRRIVSWWYLGLNGVVSFLIAVIIILLLPLSAYTIIGLFVGIEFIFTAIWLLYFAALLRR